MYTCGANMRDCKVDNSYKQAIFCSDLQELFRHSICYSIVQEDWSKLNVKKTMLFYEV